MKHIAIILFMLSVRVYAQDYLPLQIGNSWTYCGKSDTVVKWTYRIKDSLTNGGKTYFLYGRDNSANDTIRKDAFGNIWKLQGGQDSLWFDFTRDSGEVYSFPAYDTASYVVMVFRQLTKETYLGTFVDCYGLAFVIPRAIDTGILYTFAPGVGLAEISGAWEYDLLFSAVIRNTPLFVSNKRENVPDRFELRQNFPNPFNPATVITYQIPTGGLVSLKVCDLMGHEIATLVNTWQAAGEYRAVFNASKLASGVYFYILKSDKYSMVKKCAFLK